MSINKIKLHFSIDSTTIEHFGEIIENDFGFKENLIKQLIEYENCQGDEVLCQYWESIFIPKGVFLGKCFYKFIIDVPINIIQLDTNFISLDSDYMEYAFGDIINLPNKNLIHNNIFPGAKLINIYEKNILELLIDENGRHYEMFGVSIPKFKIEYLENIQLYMIKSYREFKLLEDISYLIKK
jgi:hypothetical protein